MSLDERPAAPRGKVVVDCPHCTEWQFEPKLAVSTYCRACGAHFDIPKKKGAFSLLRFRPSVESVSLHEKDDQVAKLKKRAQELQEQDLAVDEEDVSAGDSGVQSRSQTGDSNTRPQYSAPSPKSASKSDDKPWSGLNKLIGDRGAGKTAICLDCGVEQNVPGSSKSSMCTACGAHMDLRDFEIRSKSNLTIRTCGKVTLHRGGALQGTKITCRDLTVLDGSIKGKIRCLGRFRFRGDAKVIGRIDCEEFVVDEKSTITCFQTVYTTNAEIRGDATASVICDGKIHISSRGILRGNVVAAAVVIDEGGTLDGGTEIRRP